MQAAGPVRQIDHGDRHARFERVYAAQYGLILAYALRRTETRDDAADVVAEIFLTAWRRQDQAPDGPAARLWLYGIARRVLANHLRGRRRHERLSARLLAEETGTDPDSRPAAVITEARSASALAAARGAMASNVGAGGIGRRCCGWSCHSALSDRHHDQD
jgi:DNA-directed RNA polymerase specialized sigma24 family protein